MPESPHHGSESYFVLGEGLLGETLGGRPGTLPASLEAAVPKFRFSRMGPKGTGKQLGEPNRRKIAERDDGRQRDARPDPCRVHVSRPVHRPRSHLRQDRPDGGRRHLARRHRAGTLPEPRSRLPLRPRPAGSGLGQVLQRRLHLKMGSAVGGPAYAGLRPARGGTGNAVRARDHPGQAKRREPRRRADPPGDDQVPQPRRRHPPCLGPGSAEVQRGAEDRDEALPVDDPDRLPAAHLRARGRHERLQPGAQGVRGRRRAQQHADDADRVLRCRLPARAQHDPRRTTAGTSTSRTRPSSSSSTSRD